MRFRKLRTREPELKLQSTRYKLSNGRIVSKVNSCASSLKGAFFLSSLGRERTKISQVDGQGIGTAEIQARAPDVERMNKKTFAWRHRCQSIIDAPAILGLCWKTISDIKVSKLFPPNTPCWLLEFTWFVQYWQIRLISTGRTQLLHYNVQRWLKGLLRNKHNCTYVKWLYLCFLQFFFLSSLAAY